MTHAKFNVALIQMSVGGDAMVNCRRAATMIDRAAQAGAQVVCLPELFTSPYFCQREDAASFDLAEPVPGPTTDAIAEIAARLGVVVITPVFERRAAGVYHNAAAVIDADGSIASVYRKMHIPDDPGYYEKFYFTPGDAGFQAVPTRYATVGPLICWDQWYPEAARLTALRGASILFYPSAIGWHPHEKAQFGPRQLDAWQTVQRSHAVANGVYVAAVNRVGLEKDYGPGIEFWGSSFLCDPMGQIVAQGAPDREEIVLGTVDLGILEETRRNWPFLRDRRIDAYGGLDRRLLDKDVQP